MTRRSKPELLLQNAFLRQQLIVLQRRAKRPNLTWRDGRKCRCYAPQHLAALMTQSPATLPPGIADSCNNAFVVPLKAPKDRALMMVHLALSEKGFVDKNFEWYISRMEVASSIVKLGDSRNKRDVQSLLGEALMVPAREPTDVGTHSLQQGSFFYHHRQTPGPNDTLKRVPEGSPFTSILPPCLSTTALTIASPSPLPG